MVWRPTPVPAQAQPTTRSAELIAARCCLLLAAAISGYLLLSSWRGGGLAGCGPGSDCNQVLSSRWAYWFGLPVSAPALLVYLGLFAASFVSVTNTRFGALTLSAALLVLLAGAWFIILQAAVLRHICPYCLVAHVLGITAALLFLRNVPPSSPLQKGKSLPGAARPLLAGWNAPAVGAVLGFALLLWGEAGSKPARYQVAKIPTPRGTPPRGTVKRESATTTVGRELVLFDGVHKIRLDEVPLIGGLEATNAMVSLFDYTCHHCRQMHGLLLAAHQTYSNRLVIANLPMPLDGRCNPVMKRTPPAHVNACDYARIGLAIWRADRKRLSDFDQWVFEPETPPSVAETRSYAASLVGAEALERALADPWVEQQLRQDIAIYEGNYKNFGRSVMPQLIISNNMIFGPLEKPNELDTILKESFGW